jgi:hypothetical protein
MQLVDIEGVFLPDAAGQGELIKLSKCAVIRFEKSRRNGRNGFDLFSESINLSSEIQTEGLQDLIILHKM